MIRRLRSFARLPLHRRALLVEAAVWLLVARLALVMVSFQRIARRLGTFVPPTDSRVSRACAAGPDRTPLLAREIGWAVRRAARHVPFRAVCLPQAIAARIMLGRRGIGSVLHFGAKTVGDATALEAHAWLDVGGVPVTGYPIDRQIAEIGCFV